MPLYDSFYKKIIFPSCQRMHRRPTKEFLSHAQNLERWPSEKIRNWQWARLSELLERAERTVPHYREAFKIKEFPTVRSLGDFHRLPILEKFQVRDAPERFVSDECRGGLSRLRTSGSTGQPLVFYGNSRSAAAGLTAMIRARAWWGADFWQRSAVFIEHGHKFEKNWKQKISMAMRPLRERILNRLFFSAYRMSDADLERYYRKLITFRPAYLCGYATSLFLLAHYLDRKGLDGRSIGVRHVFYTSEMLYPWQKDLMEKTFGARVAGEYGMVEAGVVAHQCPAGRYHTMDDMVYVELLPLKENPMLAEILITTLYNFDAPLIRYRTGDVVHVDTASKSQCPCGLGLHSIGALEGRSHDILVSPSGQIVHGQACTHILINAGHVKKFQVMQETPHFLVVKVVQDTGYTPKHETEIRNNLQRLLGGGVEIVFEYVDEIPAEASGKFRWIRSKVGTLKRA